MPTTNETNLEKVFSDLAYSHLRDKSQGLLDYLLSFEMIKADDDGQRAVGIFGFEIDDDIYFAPAFFLNGEIRGLDSLYSAKSDLFVPLTEDWVNTLVNKRTQTIGEPDTRSSQARGTRLPNYTRLKVIPGGGGGVNLKMGGAKVALNGELPYRNDVVDSLVDVVNGLGISGHLKAALAANPRFHDSFSAFYSILDLQDAPVAKVAAEAPKLVTVITTINDEGTGALNDEERRTVIEGGTAVIDNRPEVSKSMLYETETKRIMENPTGGGLYDVLYADGSVEPTVISTQGGGDGCVVVYRPSDKKHCEINDRLIFTLRKYTQNQFHDWLRENAKKPSDITPGTTAYFISREGAGTAAFCIEDVTKGVDGIKRLVTRDRYYMEARDGRSLGCVPGLYSSPRGNNGNANTNMFQHLSWRDSVNRVNDVNNNVTEILVVERGAASPKYMKDRLVVNDDQFFYIPVNTFTEKTEGSEAPQDLFTAETYGKKRDEIVFKANDFGDYNTVSEALDKYAADLTVWRQGSDINVKIAGDIFTGNEGETLRHLICTQGLGEADARVVIKTAGYSVETFKIHLAPKLAAELLNIPEVHDTQEGSFMNAYVPGQIPFGNVNQARSSNNREFYRYQSPFGPGGSASGDESTSSGDDTLKVMDEAAKSGQKELFDSAALASLVKCYRPTEMVDRFMPTIVAGMDRLGRMLFLLYWHYDAFEERYGANDLAEFLDNLKSTYEQLGDIVIFLKKRTLAGDPEHYGLGMRASMDTSAEI